MDNCSFLDGLLSYYECSIADRDPSKIKYWINYIVDNKYPTVDVWNAFHQRYDYSVEFDFSDANDSLYFGAPWFTNGEHFAWLKGMNDGIVWENTAVLYEMNFWWRDATNQYTSFFYYNVDEMLERFSHAYGAHPGEKGMFQIHIEKGNGRYDDISIVLKIGGESYPIEKSEIRVFRDPISDLTGESELVYKNYDGDHQNVFIGL